MFSITNENNHFVLDLSFPIKEEKEDWFKCVLILKESNCFKLFEISKFWF
jgi:hypothetical protein